MKGLALLPHEFGLGERFMDCRWRPLAHGIDHYGFNADRVADCHA